MNKHLISAIITLMTLSLLGIICFQYFWISHALKLKEAQFDRQVNDALQKVVQKIDTREAVDVITEKLNTVKLVQNHMPLPDSIKPAVLRVNKNIPQKFKRKPARPADRNISLKEKQLVAPASLNAPFRDQQIFDTTTLHGLIRLQTLVDTIRLQEHVNDYLLYVNTDSSKSTAIPPDSLRQKVWPRFQKNRPAIIKEILRPRVSSDSGTSPSNYKIITRQIILEKQTRTLENIFQPGPQKLNSPGAPGRANAIVLGLDRLNPEALRKILVPAPMKQNEANRNILGKNPESLQPATVAAPTTLPIAEQKKKVSAKTKQLTEVVQQMAVDYVRINLPVEKRLPKAQLDSIVKSELNQAGIYLPFEYAVLQGQQAGLTPVRSVNFKTTAPSPKYQVRLFPNDIYANYNYLTIHFPKRNAYLFHAFRYQMGFSALFTFIILTTFGITMHTILKQKKISEIKNDFINNMTHEFKTPLATISLAADAIANPKIIQNPERIKQYAGIIRDENKRMHKQVEEVLQMALLDKQELKLNLRPICLHAIILQAIQNMQLLLETKAGRIHIYLDTAKPQVLGDEAHLGNVIANLLDNAIKYSPEAPVITVSTTVVGSSVILSVTDQGMGMSRDDQNRIFDKFYRVSTGNLHPVKGFGLGLPYVKAIVLAHKGHIKVKSEPGKGSTFEIILPTLK